MTIQFIHWTLKNDTVVEKCDLRTKKCGIQCGLHCFILKSLFLWRLFWGKSKSQIHFSDRLKVKKGHICDNWDLFPLTTMWASVGSLSPPLNLYCYLEETIEVLKISFVISFSHHRQPHLLTVSPASRTTILAAAPVELGDWNIDKIREVAKCCSLRTEHWSWENSWRLVHA